MSAMQWVPGLKGDDVIEATRFQPAAGLCGSQTQFAKIKVSRKTQHLQLSGHVSFSPTVHFRDQWMALVESAEDFARGPGEIPFVDLLNPHYGDNLIARIKQRDFAIEFDRIFF